MKNFTIAPSHFSNRAKQVAQLLVMIVPLLLISSLMAGQNNALLTGSINDEASRPITKASLTLGSLERVFQAASAKNGTFRFGSVPPGTYELKIAADPFVTQKLAIKLSRGESQSLNIVLKIGQIPNMEYCGPHPSIQYKSQLGNGRQLTGIVRDSLNQQPVARAEITLVSVGEKLPRFKGISNRAGNFQFNDPPAGWYALQVSRPGYSPKSLNELLVSREDELFIDFPITKRHKIFACQ
jgi:Carboxypeptidase regulatory-like domain